MPVVPAVRRRLRFTSDGYGNRRVGCQCDGSQQEQLEQNRHGFGRLMPWQPGTLDIHQISSGRGNAGLYIFPDGTTMLVDAGELPVKTADHTPDRPDNSRIAGERIVRYIRRVLAHDAQPTLDYILLTHFHDDHIGGPWAESPVASCGAYKLRRGSSVAGPTRSLTLPDLAATHARVAVVNDTHEHVPTVDALVARIEAVQPDVLVWNGDTCASAFDSPADVPRVLLTPPWAMSRSLLFVPGNHDVRGACAREIDQCLASGPEASLPYNVARRHGPLALLTLDTGEDKPDAHPVFAGTAAYEPYRVRQAAWLRETLQRPDIASAPFKIVFCHIPLQGLPNENDGLSLEGFAAWSGDGAKAWMPVLREAGVALVVSGHQHAWRIDDPTDGRPMQVVGGGTDLPDATLIVLEGDPQALRVTIQDLSGTELAQRHLTRR